MGLSFDILIFDCLLKAPQPVTGLFFWLTGFQPMVDQVIFNIGWVVDKACI